VECKKKLKESKIGNWERSVWGGAKEKFNEEVKRQGAHDTVGKVAMACDDAVLQFVELVCLATVHD
jgi:hypothetical protein